MHKDSRRMWAWAFYDWANSAFATTVMAGFFPVFFKQYWSAGSVVTTSTFQLGMANAVAGIVIAALAPILGSIADAGGTKSRFLLFFTAMGVVMTGGLYFVQQGDWQTAVLLYTLASLGFSGGIVFYDALLLDVAEERRWDTVSALGYALGYLGGGLLFTLNVVMTMQPQFFGLASSAEAVRWSFVLVAVWWAVFSVPVMFIREGGVREHRGTGGAVVLGLRQFVATFHEVRKLRATLLFLVAYWFYIDGVDTIIRMAVDYGMSLGLNYKDLMLALLITQFIGFPAAIAFGRIGERFGAKTGIYIGIVVYIVVTLWAARMHSEAEFYGLAVVIGLVQGGIQSLSRSYYARMVPQGKSGEFFGFYNMLGKFSTILGPLLMGWTAVLTGSSRLAVVSVVVLFLLGGVVLYFVNEKQVAKP